MLIASVKRMRSNLTVSFAPQETSDFQRQKCSEQSSEKMFSYLDPADSLLGLHHAYVLGGVPLRQQLGGAKVVCSKDDSINQVFWLARSRYLGKSGKKRAD